MSARKPKLRVVSVRWSKARHQWYVEYPGREKDWDTVGWTKAQVVAATRMHCRFYGYALERPTSLRVYKRNGQCQFECTYPRSADPRRSKG